MRARHLVSTIRIALQGCLATPAFAVRGALVQLGRTDGCISNDGTGGECTAGIGLAGAFDLDITGDGRGLYVASLSSGAVAVFARQSR